MDTKSIQFFMKVVNYFEVRLVDNFTLWESVAAVNSKLLFRDRHYRVLSRSKMYMQMIKRCKNRTGTNSLPRECSTEGNTRWLYTKKILVKESTSFPPLYRSAVRFHHYVRVTLLVPICFLTMDCVRNGLLYCKANEQAHHCLWHVIAFLEPRCLECQEIRHAFSAKKEAQQ